MSFLNFLESDLISTIYTANPGFNVVLTTGSNSELVSQPYYVFASSSIGKSRSFTNLEGRPVTGSYNISGVISYIPNVSVTDSEKKSLNRLRNIYASSSFIKIENYTSSSIFNNNLSVVNQNFNFINIPQVIYGSEIKPGSLTLNSQSGSYSDDSYGGIFSGNLHVGCVFYQHGIVLLGSKFFAASDNLTASFSGTMKMPMNIYLCRLKSGEMNFTENDSYVNLLTSSNKNEITTKNPKTFVTGVGLYDEDYKLLGVAKISTPILNEEDTNILFKLKLTY